jgi:hypothetical protein
MTFGGGWGVITGLATEFGVSRTFIYFLAHQLQNASQFIFEQSNSITSAPLLREFSIKAMLSLRLEGHSSIMGISVIMNRFQLELASVGSISQMLSHIGYLLPSTLSNTGGLAVQYLVFASDEIYSKRIPILVTLDPVSTAILRIEFSDTRTAEDWKEHYEIILANGFKPTSLVSDNAPGIRAGFGEVAPGKIWQSDTYHAIAHTLGNWVSRLEKIAYRAIGDEDKSRKKLDILTSDPDKSKEKLDRYQRSVHAAEKAINTYDNFCYLYHCLIKELNVFDDNGNVCDQETAEANVKAILALIEEIGYAKITKAVKKVERALPDLFHYLGVAKQVIKDCEDLPINKESLRAYCIAWQAGKAARKAKKTDRKEAALEREQCALEIAQALHEKDLDWNAIREEVYSRLDRIVQSSSMVECINSIIRPYLNSSKNQVNQNSLNLIMHYHNYRRYTDGVRKGKTPMEILTGKKQEKDWLAILFDIIREKDPQLLPAV